MNIFSKLFGDGSLIMKGLSFRTIFLVFAGILVIVSFAFVAQRGAPSRKLKMLAYLVRLAAAIVILAILMEPVIRKEEAIPQQSFLVHLYDTSASMKIPDIESKARIEALEETALRSDAREDLDDSYKRLQFTFDEGLHSNNTTEDELEPTDGPTDLLTALRHLQPQIKGLPVSGVVLASDGNPTLNTDRQAIVKAATDLGTPVYCVGSAPFEPPSDVWVEKVLHAEEANMDVETRVTALVGFREMKGRKTEVILYEGDDIVDNLILYPTEKEQILTAGFNIRPRNAGLSTFRVKVSTEKTEAYPWNNHEDFFMNVVKKGHKLLYVEGYPRYEYRFLRAAFEDDERFQVTSMIFLTDKGHIYRQGLSDPSELIDGFPQTEEDLFQYDVLVIGDVAASWFTKKQLELIRRFVDERGGGLLFLAGKHSFDPKGFSNTEVAEVLPFSPSSSREVEQKQRVVPTAQGIERSMFGPYDSQSDGKPPWAVLPSIKGLIQLGGLKPGAVALCSIDNGAGDQNPPVVAYQRYGHGTSLVCGVRTWPWKFQTASDDPCYSAFWKEMTLILVERAFSRVRVKAAPPISALGSEVLLQVEVFNKEFKPDPTAIVKLTIEAPGGETQDVVPQLSEDEASAIFEYSVKPASAGPYRVKARLDGDGGDGRLEHEAMFIVKQDAPELREVRLNESLLRQISSMTGGQYMHLGEYDKLTDFIKPREGSVHKVAEKSAWDKPAILIVILTLLLAEWLMRRLGNLA
ncbi:hypothetical protein ACFL1X_01555 [Candidatus Hydrogenedentota bacterium]